MRVLGMMQFCWKRTWRTRLGCTVQTTISMIKDPFLIMDLNLFLNHLIPYNLFEICHFFYFFIFYNISIYFNLYTYTSDKKKKEGYMSNLHKKGRVVFGLAFWSVGTVDNKRVKDETLFCALHTKMVPLLFVFLLLGMWRKWSTANPAAVKKLWHY